MSTITVGNITWNLCMVEDHVLIQPGCGWVLFLEALANGHSVNYDEGDEHRFTMKGFDDIDLTASVLASGCFTARGICTVIRLSSLKTSPQLCPGGFQAERCPTPVCST